ncbi:hypothetical protein [uncultured Winogradskyella sp.]|uniref:hypothetical protein n=1 Tax=uncultured Winogradskyella sp. TaxID=395353 RepID=UPI0026290EA4|nr:hypothetical protein [uncultured Winogradskyella sp.]
MQVNKLISTIETLNSVGQTESIVSLAKELKEAYDFALKIIGDNETLSDTKTDDNIVKDNILISNNFKQKFSEYNDKWNLKNKFLYILKKENRFLHFREVAQIIFRLEDKKSSYEEERDLARLISNNNSLRAYKATGDIVNIKHKGSPKKSFWGSKKWVDKDGTIKRGYEYSLDIVNNTGKKFKSSNEKDLFNL